MASFHIIVTGRVQGVGYRAFVEAEARRRQLTGWVRNRFDGSVEALLTGERNDIATTIETLRRGPPGARVDHLDASPASDDPGPEFVVLPTI